LEFATTLRQTIQVTAFFTIVVTAVMSVATVVFAVDRINPAKWKGAIRKTSPQTEENNIQLIHPRPSIAPQATTVAGWWASRAINAQSTGTPC
jgi:hypothetical protein